MRVWQLQRTQDLPISIDEAWQFFSDPRNLFKITPPDMNLVPIGEVDDHMYPGQIIQYRVRLAPAVSWRWLTEITHVDEPRSFVDEQRSGPYRLWHHRHTFREIPGGTRCGDVVHYAVPGGLLAPVIQRFLVRAQLEKIFQHRYDALVERFGPMVSHDQAA